MVLQGTEVKSIREGRVNLRDSFARVEAGEVWVYNIHISPYANRGYADHEPTRRRKLLLHRQEIRKLIGRTVEKRHDARAAAALLQGRQASSSPSASRKGKQAHDKREAIRKTRGRSRDARRDEKSPSIEK